MSVKAQISKIEKEIFPKSGPVDPEILRCITIFHERVNKNELRFTDEQKVLWIKLFGEEPRQVNQDECLKSAQAASDRYGNFKNYIEAFRKEKGKIDLDLLDQHEIELLMDCFSPLHQ